MTARIPWPNPLTSTVGLSLESLHLTFHLLPATATSHKSPVVNLADSVVSAAETFIHEELEPDEEASFRSSYHPDMAESITEQPPGGLDPFLRDEENQEDSEPLGISMFATLIENLLARFEFDATDTKITLVDPMRASFSINLSSICYRSQGDPAAGSQEEAQDNPTTSPTRAPKSIQETRTVTFNGLTVTTRSLKPFQTPYPSSVAPLFNSGYQSPEPRSPSQSSNSSDMDEDAQMLMSQSIAVFPHPGISMSSSIGNSLYQSAVSTTMEPIFEEPSTSQPPESTQHEPTIGNEVMENIQIPQTRVQEPQRTFTMTQEVEDDTILSLSSDPIVISLTTPPLLRKYKKTSPQSSTSGNPNTSEAPEPATNQAGHSRSDKIALTVSIGVIGCALQARHIRALLRISHVWGMHGSKSPPNVNVKPAKGGTNPIASGCDLFVSNLRIRGMVLLLLPTGSVSSPQSSLTQFFDHPLIPPHFAHGYVRAYLDNLDGSLVMSPMPSSDPVSKRKAPARLGQRPFDVTGSLKLTDISVFAFLPSSATHASTDLQSTTDYCASPLLVTDPHLTRQYVMPPDMKSSVTEGRKLLLPELEVIDWTDVRQHNPSPRPSLWRTKVPRPVSSRLAQPFPSDPSLGVLGGHGSPRRRPVDIPSTPSSPLRIHDQSLPGSLKSAAEVLSTSPGKNADISSQRETPALHVKFHMTFDLSQKPSRTSETTEDRIDVNIAPLHCFVDLGLLFDPQGESEAMRFLQTITAQDEDQTTPRVTQQPGEDEYHEPHAASRDVRGAGLSAMHASEVFDLTDMERDRRRLEQLLLDDLDLQFDYREQTREEVGPAPRPGGVKSKVGCCLWSIALNSDDLTMRRNIPFRRLRI